LRCLCSWARTTWGRRMEMIQGNCKTWKEDASYGQPVSYQGDLQCTKVQVLLLYLSQLQWGNAIWPKEW
jgi:hypothetical protein